MSTLLRAAACAAGLVLSAVPAAAQQARLGVYFQTTTEDTIGRQLAFYIRDEIRRSGTFQETTEEGAVFTVYFVTIDPTDTSASTSYSYVIAITNHDGLDYFVQHYVGVCGKDRVRSCADRVYTGLGEELEKLRAQLQKTDR